MTGSALITTNKATSLTETDSAGSLAPGREPVAQLYLGRTGEPAAIEKVRRRVHWITSQVRGPRVLDSGTGEGILPILLGRDGIHVIGVDADAEAIASAKDLLAQESEALRERVQFRNARLYEGDRNLLFDSIIIAEAIGQASNAD